MSPPVFYVADIPAGAVEIVLDGPDGLHAVKVRRIRVGEAIRIADGRGSYADCRVSAVGQRDLTGSVESLGHSPEQRPRLSVVQALPKGDRATLAVEVLTEIGADVVVPWQAANCVSRWDGPDKAAKGVARWRAVARAAAKQSRRVRVPDVTEIATTAEVLERVRAATLTVLLHEDATRRIGVVDLPADGEVLVVIGPEGGLSPAETEALTAAGGVLVRLGPEVLRTSTAGVSALAVLAARSGRWA